MTGLTDSGGADVSGRLTVAGTANITEQAVVHGTGCNNPGYSGPGQMAGLALVAGNWNMSGWQAVASRRGTGTDYVIVINSNDRRPCRR